MTDIDRFSTVVGVMHDRAESMPDKLAFIFLRDGETVDSALTFAALDHQAHVLAGQLSQYVQPGERVLLVFPSGLDILVAFAACLYAGLVAVPCEPPAPGRPFTAQQAFAADAGARLALTTTPIFSAVREQLDQDAVLGKLRWLQLEHLLTVPAPLDWQPPRVAGHTLILLSYTSGSTSTPRGTCIAHSNLLSHMRGAQLTFERTYGEALVFWGAPYLGNVLRLYLTLPLCFRVPLVLLPTERFLERPVRWLQAISRFRAGYSIAPNFAFQACVEQVKAVERAGLDLSGWHNAIGGAEAIRNDILARFAETYAPYGFSQEALRVAYGMSEALFISSQTRTSARTTFAFDRLALAEKRVVPVAERSKEAQVIASCGIVSAGTRVMIVNPETLIVCSPAEVGEIWVSGSEVAQGYWNQPEETAHVFGAHLADTGEGPFLRTGDLGFFHQGELFVAGRLREMIILNGRNIYVHDIEKVAEQSHPALQPGCSAAFSIPKAGDESTLVLMHEVQPADANVDVNEVARTVRQAVAAQMQLPVYAVVLVKAGSLPRTDSGKIQRYRCREIFLARQASAKAAGTD